MHISLVDDNLLMIDALKNLLELMSEVEKVGVFTNGEDFFRLHRNDPPDIVILNHSLAGLHGADLLDNCRNEFPKETRLMVLTQMTDLQTIKHTIRRGANAVLSTQTSFEELKDALFQVAKGKQYIGLSLRDNLINSVFSEEQTNLHLSPREREVLQRVCSGHTIKEIAYDLRLSAHTVQYYHRNVMDKLKVKRTTDLIVYAIQHKLYIPEHGK